MPAFIVHFVGKESKIAHSRLKDFVKIIGDAGTQTYILSFGAIEAMAI